MRRARRPARRARASLDGLGDLRARRQLRVAPVGALRQYGLGGGEIGVRGLHTTRNAAIGYRLHRVQQQAAGLDDGAVGRAQVLAAAIDDGAHALLDGAVLRVDAVDAGETLGLLDVAVEQVVVLAVAD